MKKATVTTIDEYLAATPEPARTTLSKIRATIRSAVPKEATESISYGLPTARHNGALVAYGAFKQHCSFFPMSYAAIAAFRKELEPYDTAKGTIHFPLDKPLPATLVKKIVKARLAENEARALKKQKRKA
jgi:uncharacterized protein YdhG (YjbR/CyaY superfamily)